MYRIATWIAFVLLCSTPLHAGVNAFTSTGPKGGWKMVAADPNVAGRVFAISDKAFYRSTDSGAHWTKVNSALLPESIAFDASAPDRVYAVTGRTIQRSDDGGATFAPYSTVPIHESIVLSFFAAADVGRVTISPHDANEVYLTDGSLFHSVDGARTFAIAAQTETSYVYDFAIDAVARDTVYIANHATTVAKSSDRGTTWKAAADGIPQGWAGVRIATDPTSPSRLYLLAGRKSNTATIAVSFDEYTVFVSNDSGAHWQATSLDLAVSLPWPQLQLFTTRDAAYVRAAEGLYRSTDGGATWQILMLRNGDLAQAFAAGATTLYAAGMNYGMQRSDNRGASWDSARNGLPLSRVARVEIAPGDTFSIFAATDFNATLLTELYRRSATDNAWVAAFLAPNVDWKSSSSGNVTFIDFQREPYGFAAFATLPATGDAIAMTNSGQVLRMSDGESNFTPIGGGKFSFLVDKLAVAPSDNDVVYACGAGRPDSLGISWISGPLARSKDGGTTWETLSATPNGYNFGCAAIAVDPANADVAYLALVPDIGGAILRTTDGGSTWRQIAPLAANISAMLVDPSERRRLITGRRYPYSVFALDTITGLDTQLGDTLPGAVTDVAIDSASTPPVLYVGTDRGIYTRPVTAANVPWTPLRGAESFSVNALRLARAPQNPTRITVIAATESGVQQSTIDTQNTLQPVYRFFNRDTQAHLYTASKSERDNIAATWPQFADEGIAFLALVAAETSSTPVYRFYNTKTGVHAYAFGDDERTVLQTLPDEIDEGAAFYMLSSAEPGASALYRFFNATTGGYLLTVDDDERDFVRRRLRQFAFKEASPGVFQAAD